MKRTLQLDGRVTRGDFALDVSQTFDLAGIHAIFGRSGSGKTTLLRVIAGLVPDATCRVVFDGSAWQDGTHSVPAFKRRIGYVFQDSRLFTHLNVRRNLEYATRFTERHGPIGFDTVVEALELRPLFERNVPSLSGGETQRVALGRALISNPRLLLMDEPLSSLDLERKREIVDYIARLPQQFDVPIIYVTHNPDEVARLARTATLLNAGRIVAHGETSAVFGSAECGPILGRDEASSILLGTIEERRGPLTLVRVGRQQLKVPNIKAPAGSDVQIRIRAKDVVIATRAVGNLSIRNSLSCRLIEIQDHDVLQTELLLDTEGQSLRALVTREAVDELQLAAGATVFALIKSIAFDAAL